MVKPFRVRGKNKKRKMTEQEPEPGPEAYDTEEEEEQPTSPPAGDEEDEKIAEEAANELPGIPLAPSVKPKGSGVIFVLEKASLEVAKVGKTYQLLNSDDHANFLRKHGRDPAAYRPDIAHQALLMILDSPLNKAGRLRAIYVRTEKGVLFQVNPQCRMPRTFKRFCGVMLQLLQKLSVNASGKREKLLRVIKNPVTQHLPVNSHKIGFSVSSNKLVELGKYAAAVSDDADLVFVVGAMSHGKIDVDYIDDFISVSGFPLSAAYCIARICTTLEQKWNVL